MYYLSNSFTVTAKLICAFVFAYADCWFSHEAAQIDVKRHKLAIAIYFVKLTFCFVSFFILVLLSKYIYDNKKKQSGEYKQRVQNAIPKG